MHWKQSFVKGDFQNERLILHGTIINFSKCYDSLTCSYRDKKALHPAGEEPMIEVWGLFKKDREVSPSCFDYKIVSYYRSWTVQHLPGCLWTLQASHSPNKSTFYLSLASLNSFLCWDIKECHTGVLWRPPKQCKHFVITNSASAASHRNWSQQRPQSGSWSV